MLFNDPSVYLMRRFWDAHSSRKFTFLFKVVLRIKHWNEGIPTNCLSSEYTRSSSALLPVAVRVSKTSLLNCKQTTMTTATRTSLDKNNLSLTIVLNARITSIYISLQSTSKQTVNCPSLQLPSIYGNTIKLFLLLLLLLPPTTFASIAQRPSAVGGGRRLYSQAIYAWP